MERSTFGSFLSYKYSHINLDKNVGWDQAGMWYTDTYTVIDALVMVVKKPTRT